MNWDDIKVLLALSRRGSARGAAQALKVSKSTVTRRLDDLEHRMQVRLFDRTPDGYQLTATGEELLPTAEHVEELLNSAERRVSGQDQNLQGLIRLTTPNVSGMGFLMNRLSAFAQEYPDIEIELMPGSEALDLARREADIAVRVMPAGVKPPDYLIGRYLSPVSASTYVHEELLSSVNPADVSHLSWIGKNPEGQREDWLDATDYPDRPVRHAISNLGLLLSAVQAKMGMAFMPCFSTFEEQSVVRVPGATVVHHSDMWVLTHKDLRLSARLRVLRELIAEEFGKLQHQLDTR